MELQVLRALTSKEGWKRFGGSFREDYFEDPDCQRVFQAVWLYWTRRGEEDQAPENVLKNLIEQTVSKEEHRYSAYDTLALVLEYDLDGSIVCANQAIYYWRGREILTEAISDLTSNRLNPAHVAEQMSALDRALNPPKEVPLSLTEASEILTYEAGTGKYSTGILDLDDALDGGLWAGELGIVVGTTYGGKTWALVALGCAALRLGIPVLHFTMEISRARAATRYYQNLLGWNRIRVIRRPEEVEAEIGSLDLPPWEILDYSASGVRVGEVRRQVEDFIITLEKKGGIPSTSISNEVAESFSPVKGLNPLILVDHLDLDTIFPNDLHLKERFALTSCTESLRQLAVEFQVGVWTAIQANRPGFAAEYLRMDHVAESLGPPRKADVVLTLNQSEDEAMADTMRVAIAKARERTLSRRVVPIKSIAETQRLEQIGGV